MIPGPQPPEALPLPPTAAATLGSRRLLLRRVWPRDRTHLLVEYRDAAADEPVPGQWFRDDRGEADRSRVRRIARQTGRTGTGAVVSLPARGLLLQAGGADRRLTTLGGILRAPAATLVSHRPERRAVVCLGTGAGRRYAKVVRSQRLDDLVGAGRLAAATGVRAPRLLDVPPGSGVTVWSALPGRSLHDLLPSAASGVAAAAAVGRALRALHGARGSARLRVHTVTGELAVVDRWVGHVADHLPDEADARVQAARRLLLDRPSRPPALVLVHRDLHDKQVLVDDAERAGFIDLDTLAWGEPALDLANLLVHLELRALQGHCSLAQAAAAATALMDAYRPHQSVSHRLAWYASAARLRLSCVYLFRPGGRACAAALLARADEPLLVA